MDTSFLQDAYEAVGLDRMYHEHIPTKDLHSSQTIKEYAAFLHRLAGNWGKHNHQLGCEVEGFIIDRNNDPYPAQDIVRDCIRKYSKGPDWSRPEINPAVVEFAFPEPVPIAKFEWAIHDLFMRIHLLGTNLLEFADDWREEGLRIVLQSYLNRQQPSPNPVKNPHYANLIQSWTERQYQLAASCAGIHFSFGVQNLQEAITIHDSIRHHYGRPNLVQRFLMGNKKADLQRIDAIHELEAWDGFGYHDDPYTPNQYGNPWGFFQACKNYWNRGKKTGPIDPAQLHEILMIKPGRIELRSMGSCDDPEKVIKKAKIFHKRCLSALREERDLTMEDLFHMKIW